MHEGEEDHIHLEGGAGPVAFVGERLTLRSVGVDIGTSTSHLVFSRLTLERQGLHLSSRYALTDRAILYRSPVIFTPYASPTRLDGAALAGFIGGAYGDAGLTREDVDAGAVIATGEAARRENARAVAELFSSEGGKFVCATAGPNLESLLAAHGSGAVELSRRAPEPLLNIDVGGGTTKFAVCDAGRVRETGALHLGARLVVWDDAQRLVRLEGAGARLAGIAGVAGPLALGEQVSAASLEAIAGAMAELILSVPRAASAESGAGLWLTSPLAPRQAFSRIVFSGGVAEYVYGHEDRSFGDLGPQLAAALRRRAGELGLSLLEPREGIRATCIGASQYTVQLSGDTIFLSDPQALPLRNMPVVAAQDIEAPSAERIAAAVRRGLDRLDLDTAAGDVFALAVQWPHGADYASLRALCAGIATALPGMARGRPLLLVTDADVAGLVGPLLQEEFAANGTIVCVDQVALREFDYVDIGRPLAGRGVVPVVVKSLQFR